MNYTNNIKEREIKIKKFLTSSRLNEQDSSFSSEEPWFNLLGVFVVQYKKS
jgi:hypothetical protein